MLTGILLLITAALVIISLTTALNLFVFPHLRHRAMLDDPPLVSIMIPARDEAAVIGATIERLLAQDYPAFEIIVLDDNSTDDTGAIVRGFQAENITVIDGAALPAGWMGKNWACHQMQEHAKGEILLFTDADVRWSPTAVRAVVENMQATTADLFTVWPTQITQTWPERLIVPLMLMVIVGYLPIVGTHYLPFSIFGAANGQCMAWRRSAYYRVGGHRAVSDNVLEDVTLARMTKAAGLRLRMAEGNQMVSCRMYDGWPAVRDGFAKNILAGYGNSVPLLVLATVFHWAIFLGPLAFLLVEAVPSGLALGLVVLGFSIRAVTAAYSHQRVADAVLMPLSVILMTRIAFHSIYWHYRYGGPQWKGRIIQRKT
jgi:chlorobactene glucosyltransferase